MFRQVTQVDEIARGGDASGGDDILKIAHISGPKMLSQNGLSAPGKTGNVFAISIVVFLHEKLHQKRNVFEALRQRWNTNLNGTGDRRDPRENGRSGLRPEDRGWWPQ